MKFFILVLIITLIILSGIFLDYFSFLVTLVKDHHTKLSSFVDDRFVISLIFFTVAYFVSTALSFPTGAALTFIGGYLFDILYGFFAVITGATLGVLTLFLMVRKGITNNLHTGNKHTAILTKMKSGLEKDLWYYLFFIRLFPIFPFWFVNVVPALLGVRVIPFMVTTFLGIMPGTFFIVILGSGVEDIFSAEINPTHSIFENKIFLLSLCSLSFIAIFPVIYKYLKKLRGID